jgi:hypothetical protein
MSAAQTAVSIAKSVPLGTTIIVALSSALFMIDSFTGYKINDSLCLSSNRLTTGIFSHFFSLILNPLVHAGPLHYTVGVLMFPIVATGVEKQLGTIGFLNLFVTGTLITSMAYILVTWTVSWFVASVSCSYDSGEQRAPVDWIFRSLLCLQLKDSIDAGFTKLQGALINVSRIGINIPDYLYPLPFLGIYMIFFSFTTLVGHIMSCAVGCLYFLGVLDPVFRTDTDNAYRRITAKLGKRRCICMVC